MRTRRNPPRRRTEPGGIPTEPPGCYTGYMKTVPSKNYTPLSTLNQLFLPMDAGVLIPQDDSVRLLVFVLKQLNLKPLYEAYAAYGEKRRRAEAAREREAAERGEGTLPAVDEAEAPAPQPGREREKKKDGRPPCDILVLLAVVRAGEQTGQNSGKGRRAGGQRQKGSIKTENPPPIPSKTSHYCTSFTAPILSVA